MATSISRILGRSAIGAEAHRAGKGALLLVWVLLALGLDLAAAPTDGSPAARVARIHAESRDRHQRATGSVEVAWQFGRACFEWAELATNNAQRAQRAQEGIQACRQGVALDPKSAAAHYYLGLNLGLLAQTRKLGALALLGDIEAAWKTSLGLDPKFDYAGAHRSIGILYRDAPGWPVSLGSRVNARSHLQKALELAPEYPGNQLFWLESLLHWGERKAAQDRLSLVESNMAAARAKLTGPEWTLNWEDWDHRWQALQTRLGLKPLKSPKNGA